LPSLHYGCLARAAPVLAAVDIERLDPPRIGAIDEVRKPVVCPFTWKVHVPENNRTARTEEAGHCRVKVSGYNKDIHEVIEALDLFTPAALACLATTSKRGWKCYQDRMHCTYILHNLLKKLCNFMNPLRSGYVTVTVLRSIHVDARQLSALCGRVDARCRCPVSKSHPLNHYRTLDPHFQWHCSLS
jgi:hypothetical protein